MKIVGIAGATPAQITLDLQAGGRFVIYQWCVSIIVMSFKRNSSIYFIRAGESAVTKGFPYCLISFVLGWWGIPWGPIWSIATIVTNLRGGRDVTAEVVRSFNAPSGAAG